mgnify:CR=1 FL=1
MSLPNIQADKISPKHSKMSLHSNRNNLSRSNMHNVSKNLPIPTELSYESISDDDESKNITKIFNQRFKHKELKT